MQKTTALVIDLKKSFVIFQISKEAQMTCSMRHCTSVGQRIFIQIFKFMKISNCQTGRYHIYKKCFQLILVQLVTIEAI